MREILLKSPQCPKTQAALLIALDLCADKMEAKAEVEALREQLAAESEATKSAKDSCDRAQSINLKLESEKADLIAENAKLRAIIENAKKNNTIPAEELETVEQLTIDDVQSEEKPAEEPKKDNSRSRVGSMFDLLTFSDI